MESEACVICKLPIKTLPSATPTEKGCGSILKASPQQIAKFTAPVKSACDSAIEQYRLQSTEDQFHFKTDCLFCVQPAMNDMEKEI